MNVPDDPFRSDMMRDPNNGHFVRALLPVQLTGGYSVTFGVWVAVDRDDLVTAFNSWWDASYSDLRLTGRMANVIQPWDVYRASVDIAVRNPDELPYCVSSDSSAMQSLITQEWDHELVLSALAEP